LYDDNYENEIEIQLILPRIKDAFRTIEINATLEHSNLARQDYYEKFWKPKVLMILANEFLNDLRELNFIIPKTSLVDHDLDYDVLSLFWVMLSRYIYTRISPITRRYD
jgi:hypothetical protein